MFQTAPLSNPGQLTTEYDFLQILLDELAAQGTTYRAASVIETFSKALPSNTEWIRWTDRNAIIVRDDLAPAELTTANPMGARFATPLPVQIAGTTIELTRGWTSVDVRFQGAWMRVFDTHFEAFHPLVRQVQVGDLAALASSSPYPVILAGDINLYPEGQRVGVRNSDHPCDLRLRRSWPPARRGAIAHCRGRARGTCPNRMWMKTESDALRSSPEAPHALAPKARRALRWRSP
jgi:endonuclease/exonuclease/phosphatase family metal-dependent hydrolase